MKQLIGLTIIALVFSSLFFGSCTKEILKEVTVTDTIKIVTHDSTLYVVGMDSVKADFTYSISYSTDSTGYANFRANTSSYNVPIDATYYWALDGNLQVVNNQNYFAGAMSKTLNGPHILLMTITCPSIKKVYNVSKSFTIKLK